VLKYPALLKLFKLPRHVKGERLLLRLQLLQKRKESCLDCRIERSFLGVATPVLGRLAVRTRLMRPRA
jgi:hypothetical protein